MYRANLHLACALRVVRPISQFDAPDEHALYGGIRAIDWSTYIDTNATIAVESALATRAFTHSKYVALKTKDAIVDQFRDRSGSRPSVNVVSPDLRVHVYIHDTTVTVSLDSSGDSLHRRGYRTSPTEAPLNEVTAASIVRYSGWTGGDILLDPMCGSGTIAIEAALRAAHRPPGMCGRSFGFQRWRGFDNALWQEVIREAEQGSAVQGPVAVWAADADARALVVAREHATKAGVAGKIDFKLGAFERLERTSAPGTIVMNPPYGERLALSDAAAFYRKLGEVIRGRYDGWRVWVLSANRDALEGIGLETREERIIYNGKLECLLRRYGPA